MTLRRAFPQELVPAEYAGEPNQIEPSRTLDFGTMPASIAQQIFSIVPGIAGGIGGFLLASRLANATTVETKGVLLASGAVALLTLGAIYLIVEAE